MVVGLRDKCICLGQGEEQISPSFCSNKGKKKVCLEYTTIRASASKSEDFLEVCIPPLTATGRKIACWIYVSRLIHRDSFGEAPSTYTALRAEQYRWRGLTTTGRRAKLSSIHGIETNLICKEVEYWCLYFGIAKDLRQRVVY